MCALLSACKSEYEVTGVQSFCVDPVERPEGPALEVTVQVDACLSSSCDRMISSECGFTEVDGVLQLHASATIESKGKDCTADCQSPSATCTIPVEVGQTYVLRDDDGDEVQIVAGADEGRCSVEPL